MPVSAYLKDPKASRFLSGGLAEAEVLLGSPLPLLPPPEYRDGQPLYLVRFHPRLQTLLQGYLKIALAEVGVQLPDLSPKPEVRARDRAEYEAALHRALRGVRFTDRRLGLGNLFWLAHSREVARQLRQLEARAPQVKRVKHALPAMLSALCRRAEQDVRRELERSAPEQVMLLNGGQENTSIVDAVLDDAFYFTETSFEEMNLGDFIANDRRHRVTAPVFEEFKNVLVREVERRVGDGDRALLARIARHAPDIPREELGTPKGALRAAFCPPVMLALLADAWGTGARLQAAARLRSEVERRGASEVVESLIEFVGALKRFELLSALRDRVEIPGDADFDDCARRGMRMYDFGESAQVLNAAVNATVLFLDLRGFTKTSEGRISERDLTRELYTVFDAFVPHIVRFGGSIDKFLGDGMMVTYGTDHADPAGPLNAVRTAILCQRALDDLRRRERTAFKMGVSVHYGRVYLARFVVDETDSQNTVIGRHVNLAGRLSSAAKKPMEEDEANTDPGVSNGDRSLGLSVTVDAEGQLFNEGIAVSRAAFSQIEPLVELEDVEDGPLRRLEFRDPEIGCRVLFRYAGDAKFKGVSTSFPVFEVDYRTGS